MKTKARPSPETIERGACAIANTRARRRGRPGIGSMLELLSFDEREQLKAEAEAAITAAMNPHAS